jgi:murein DD-endopeptidase MepM/ murein hydrolase activator NlpD
MITSRRLPAALLSILLLSVSVLTASAQMGGKGGEGKLGLKGSRGKSMDGGGSGGEGRLGIRPSELVPVFAPGARCPPVASSFASATRFDGSRRPVDRFGGLHGGLDISLAEGTPLLAAAAGTVVHKGEGGQAEGIYLWLRHAPDDTGLPFWVFSKYQHFRELPALAVGTHVTAGERVGLSGRSGTVGGHYGATGYPHLHWTTIASPSSEFRLVGSLVSASSPRFIDPIAVYVSGLNHPSEVNSLLGERRKVAIAHVEGDGSLRPAGARLVWPVACQAQ